MGALGFEASSFPCQDDETCTATCIRLYSNLTDATLLELKVTDF